MPPGRLPLEAFKARPTGRRPWGRPRTLEGIYLWAGLGTPQDPQNELENVAGEREV